MSEWLSGLAGMEVEEVMEDFGRNARKKYDNS
jgi:hypothetical protein